MARMQAPSIEVNRPPRFEQTHAWDLKFPRLDSQIGTADAGIQVPHGTIETDPALFDNINAVRHLRRKMQVLLRKQYRQACGFHFPDDPGHLVDDDRRETLGGLVEQDRRPMAPPGA